MDSTDNSACLPCLKWALRWSIDILPCNLRTELLQNNERNVNHLRLRRLAAVLPSHANVPWRKPPACRKHGSPKSVIVRKHDALHLFHLLVHVHRGFFEQSLGSRIQWQPKTVTELRNKPGTFFIERAGEVDVPCDADASVPDVLSDGCVEIWLRRKCYGGKCAGGTTSSCASEERWRVIGIGPMKDEKFLRAVLVSRSLLKDNGAVSERSL